MLQPIRVLKVIFRVLTSPGFFSERLLGFSARQSDALRLTSSSPNRAGFDRKDVRVFSVKACPVPLNWRAAEHGARGASNVSQPELC